MIVEAVDALVLLEEREDLLIRVACRRRFKVIVDGNEFDMTLEKRKNKSLGFVRWRKLLL